METTQPQPKIDPNQTIVITAGEFGKIYSAFLQIEAMLPMAAEAFNTAKLLLDKPQDETKKED